MTDRLYRSPTDRVIAGVAGGLAVWLNLDPSLVRVAWVLLAILSGGIFVLVYIVMMIVVPLPPPGWLPQPRAPGQWTGWSPSQPGPGAVPGWDSATAPSAGEPPQPGTTPPPAGWTSQPAAGWTSQPPAWTPQPGAHQAGPGSAGIVVGAVLVLVGAWFLIDQYVNIEWDLAWPVVVIGLGALLIGGALWRGRSSPG